MIFLLGFIVGILLFTIFLIWFLEKEEKGYDGKIKNKRK